MRQLRLVHTLHVATDLALVSLGWLGAYGLRYALNDPLGSPVNPFYWYLRAVPLIAVPWVFSCWLFGFYHRSRTSTAGEELQDLLRGVALGSLVVSAIGFFFRELEFSRVVILACAGQNLVLQGASRALFRSLERRMRRSGACDIPVLIVGTGVTAIRLLQKLQDHPEIGYRVVGFVSPDAEPDAKDVAGHPLLGCVDGLPRIAEESGVGEVFVADPGLSHARMLSLVLDCEDLGLTFRCVTNLFEVLTAGTSVELVDDLPLVRLGRERRTPLYEPSKRVFDLAAALLILPLAAPLLLACALRIRATSPGPALFRQLRVGRHGVPFQLYKFRTMHLDADPYAVAPRRHDDPRITRAGRWLRATSLDELPQLLNVIRGEMSLVGPRPEMPFVVERYDEWQRRRLSVKPGITGLWQILGRKDLPMHENLQYDFYYIRNRSLLFDCAILLRTVGAVVSRKGAF